MDDEMSETNEEGTMYGMTIHEQAESIYKQVHASDAVIAAYGANHLQPIQLATVEEIERHLQIVADAAAEFGVNLYPEKIPFPATPETARAAAERKVAHLKKTAGARALVAKYGAQGASNIVYRKTGKRINFQG